MIAHSGKVLDGGLPQLRDKLRQQGVTNPWWFEIAKGSQASQCARSAVKKGARTVLVWGGDGTVQRSLDVLVDTGVALGILPAGTANLLARNLGIPVDLDQALDIALHGGRTKIDTGVINGEHFSLMAGAGFDALMIHDADSGLKDRLGRAAYLWTGLRNLQTDPVEATIRVDGRKYFKGDVTCFVVGNLSRVAPGVELFEGSRADDGLLEFGVVQAKTRPQWLMTIGRTAVGNADDSPFVVAGRGSAITVRFDRQVPYELDGGVRGKTKALKIAVAPHSVEVCVPVPGTLAPSASHV